MKTYRNLLLPFIMFCGFHVVACAQPAIRQSQPQDHQKSHQKGRYDVSARLTESNGNYDQRKICRAFLADAMQQCPYVSDFRIEEDPGAGDNHQVVWHYRVNSWDDITRFYDWVNKAVYERKDKTLLLALEPYRPDYAIGGKIEVHDRRDLKRSVASK